MVEKTGDMLAVIDAARAGVRPADVNAAQHLIFIPLANGGEGAVISLEKHHSKPTRKRGSVDVFDVASFNQVIADNKDAGDASIYLDRNPTSPSIVAILNGNGAGGPGWGDLRVNLIFRETPQWAKWKSMDGKMVPQATFAEFVEDNLSDVSDPPGAAMLEIVTYLQVTRTTDFKSAVRLSSGAIQFQNLQTDDAKVAAGTIQVPETFTLGLSPFQGAPAYNVPARFRYRLVEGKLTLGLKLQRVEDMVGQIFEDIVAKIERGTNVSVLDGRAPLGVTAIG